MLLNRVVLVFFFKSDYFQNSGVSVACEDPFCVSFLYDISHTNLSNEKITVGVYNVNSSAGYHRAVDPGVLTY